MGKKELNSRMIVYMISPEWLGGKLHEGKTILTKSCILSLFKSVFSDKLIN